MTNVRPELVFAPVPVMLLTALACARKLLQARRLHSVGSILETER